MAVPSVFNDSQISSFLSYISFPSSLQTQRYTGTPSLDLDLLTQLHIYTITAIPYENLWLHYNSTHTNTIDPQSLFTSTVTNARGRGGYCFQVSIFFNHILRGLGFPAYLAPVRIRLRVNGIPHGDYTGWRHLVNIVTLSDGTKYVLDVGCGGDGPTAPIPLVHDAPQKNLGTQDIRLVRDWIPTQLHRTEESKVWIYQCRNGKYLEWHAFYTFAEMEAMEADFHILNWYTGAHPESFQTFTCLVVKFLRREGLDGKEEIYGKRMLVDGLVKENLGGRTSVVERCEPEEERVRALEKWFGITLTEEEQQGIRGWPTELTVNGSEGSVAGRGKSGEVWEVRRGARWQREWRGPAEGSD
jgi:arylamine N-acetyltransferase